MMIQALSVFFLLIATPGVGEADPSCPKFHRLGEILESLRPTTLTPEQRNSAYQEAYTEKNRLAEMIFEKYFFKQESVDLDFVCAGKFPHFTDFVDLASTIFLEKTHQYLSSSPAPMTKNFGNLVANFIKSGRLFSFRIEGLGLPNLPSSKAGYHRTLKTVFMNLKEVNSTEWLFIYVHEMSHAMDPLLSEGNQVFNDQLLTDEVLFLARTTASIANLTAPQKEKIHRWLHGGLDRGLLAEFRAWWITLQIYHELSQMGLLVHKVPWLEEIPFNRSSPMATYRYLEKRFTVHDSGPFQYPLLRRMLRKYKAGLKDVHSLMPKVFSPFL